MHKSLFYGYFAVYWIHFRSARTSVLYNIFYYTVPVTALQIRRSYFFTIPRHYFITALFNKTATHFRHASIPCHQSYSIYTSSVLQVTTKIHFSRLASALNHFYQAFCRILDSLSTRPNTVLIYIYLRVCTVFDTTISLIYIDYNIIYIHDLPIFFRNLFTTQVRRPNKKKFFF
jgi:hypothetical protein